MRQAPSSLVLPWAGVWRDLGHSSVEVSHTGDTNETTLATVSIPAGAIGANGMLLVESMWNYTNSANNKTMRVRMDGIGGTAFLGFVATTTATYNDRRIIGNRNAQNVQVVKPINSATVFGATSGAVATAAVDTSAAVSLVFTAALANTGETIALQQYLVQVLYAA